jgi:hypothetical protein
LAVVPDNKIDRAVAEIAHTVKKHDLSHRKILPHKSDRIE